MPSEKNDLRIFDNRMPSQEDLSKIFQEVLWPLTYLSTHPAEPSEIDWEKLILQRMVRFTGTINGFLLLKCSKEFASLLAKSILGRETSMILAEDAVSELMNVFCGRLMSDFWDPASVRFGNFLPRALFLDPASERPADLNLLLQVEKEPLQIQAWFRLAPSPV